MPYAILRFKKHPGGVISHMENHNERKKEKYSSNPDVDVNRRNENYYLVQPQTTYRREIQKRILQAGCKVRKDSILMIETLLTCSPEYMQRMPLEEQRKFFEHALEFIKTEVDPGNIFSAVVHMDESNPHMHLCFTPITPDKRLSAKIIMGGPDKLSLWQDKYYEHMSAQYPQLERGIPASESKRKHIPVRLFKQAKRLEEQMTDIERALTNITAFNAGKKREEALRLLAKWLPAAEGFSKSVKKNDEYIRSLEAKSKSLESELDKKAESLDTAYADILLLRQTANRQRQILDKLPPEVLAELRSRKPTERIK